MLFLEVDELIRLSNDGPQGGGHLQSNQHEDDDPQFEVSSMAATHAVGGPRDHTDPKNKADEPDDESEESEEYD